VLSLTTATLLLACAARAPEPRASVIAPEVPAGETTTSAATSATATEAPGSAAQAHPPAASEEKAAGAPPPTPVDLPKGTLVLHIGDSFAASLGVPLGKRFKAAGVRYILEFETASYVPTWAFGDELPKYIGKYNPDFVMVTLGANEIEIPNPEQRAGAVKRLIKHLGGRPCVWVLPPLWKADTGFMKVISESSTPCRVLDSTSLVGDLPRKKDKIHPNEEGRELWAEAVFGWLSHELQASGERPWTLKPR
jgi:hypothetical protein